nr:MAG TPA: hypothetical protein [Caudoviricetes sp.]
MFFKKARRIKELETLLKIYEKRDIEHTNVLRVLLNGRKRRN